MADALENLQETAPGGAIADGFLPWR